MKRWIILIFFVAFLVMLAIVFVGIALQHMTGSTISPSISSDSVLQLDLKGYYPEEPPQEMLDALLDRRIVTHRLLLYSIEKAATDDKIHSLYIRLSPFAGIGWARAKEIRDALLAFKEAGKDITVYMEFGGDKEYYVATAADKIVCPPGAILPVDGLFMQMLFLKDTYAKVGVEWEEVHAGKYKSAPETNTRSEMSEANREVMNDILDHLYDSILGGIIDGRGITEEEARALIDNGPYLQVDLALEAGLIDEIAYETDILERLGVDEDGDMNKVKGSHYMKSVSYPHSGHKVALIYIAGTIVVGDSQVSPFGDKFVGSNTVVKWLESVRDDDDAEGLILRVDSPGGSALAADVIWKAIEEVRAKKPVVVTMGDLAASGGYYVSMGADYIFAEPTTLTGSIGVYFMRPIIGGLYDKIGVNPQTMTRGENADLFDPTVELSPEQRQVIQGFVNGTYHDFVSKAALGRNMSYEEIDNIAQGRVWMGTQAVENDLVDAIGDMDSAVKKVKELADLTDEDVWLDVYPRRKDFWELLREGNFPFAAIQTSTAPDVSSLQKILPREMHELLNLSARQAMFQPGEPLALLPYEVVVE